MLGGDPVRLDQVELQMLDRFKEWVGYSPQAAGSLVSGASMANLAALACAREALAGEMNQQLVIYLSDQAHPSLARAARLLGFRPRQVRVLPTDPGTDRLAPAVVAAAMEADRREGRVPLCLVANAGAVDPLAELCRVQGAWLHADAAYGEFAVHSERGRAQLGGLERADSITLDPHQLPYRCGCLLVRDGETLRSAFCETALSDLGALGPAGPAERLPPRA